MIRLFKVEGFGSDLATTSSWLAPLMQRLRTLGALAAGGGVDVVSTIWSQMGDNDGKTGAAMLANGRERYTRQAILAHSYAVAGSLRALAAYGAEGGYVDVLLALDGVPRWAWGQVGGTPSWSAPANVGVVNHWFQKNLGPCGEKLLLPAGPSKLSGLFQMDMTSRGVLHTDVPVFPEVQSSVVSIVRSMAA